MNDQSRIADENQILKLANAYSHAVMRRDGVRAAAVYTEDGQLTAFSRPPIVGRAALEAAFVATFSPLLFITQACVAQVIEVDGDRATASFSVNEFLRAKGQGDVLSCCFGVYEDRLVRTAHGWRFSHRRFSPFFRGAAVMEGKLYDQPAFENDFSNWPLPGVG
jgi:ketosteroid isomerase-like protein